MRRNDRGQERAEKVRVTGGYGDSGYLASSELYDPANGSWMANQKELSDLLQGLQVIE